jgi:hypothetical protein
MPAEAAKALATLLPQAPDDGELHLRLGWLWFQAGDYEQAWIHYTRASKGLPDDPDPGLGLAWTAYRQGRSCTARTLFASVLERHPGLAAASEGLELVGNRCWTLTAGAAATGQKYAGNPWKNAAVGGTVNASVLYDDRLLFSVVGRYGWFWAGTGAGFEVPPNFGQPEAYLSAAWVRDSWGVALHYAFADELNGNPQLTEVVGVSARVGLFGAETSLSWTSTTVIERTEAGVRIPLPAGLSLSPSAAGQWTPEGLRGSVALTASWQRKEFSLWVTGRWGREIQPVYLTVPAIYNIPDDVIGGVSAGLWIPVNPHFAIEPSYEWHRLELTGSSGTLSSDAHFLTIGFQWSSRPWGESSARRQRAL